MAVYLEKVAQWAQTAGLNMDDAQGWHHDVRCFLSLYALPLLHVTACSLVAVITCLTRLHGGMCMWIPSWDTVLIRQY